MTEGKIARGWRLTRQSWSVVRLRPGLLGLPAGSAVFTLAAAVLLLGPWSLDVIDHHSRGRLFVDTAVCAYPFTFIGTYFNVAFYSLAAATFDGRPMTTGEALRRARRRVAAVALWALVATVAGTALRALEQLPVGGLAARVAEWIGSVAWSLASFFVVPVLALEDVGVGAALRRSVGTIRSQWGESVTGVAVIGTVFGMATFTLFAVGGVGVGLGRSGFEAGYALTAVAAVAFVTAVLVQEAVGQVFRLAVFRHASGEGGTGPFATADLDAAFKPRRH
ncbi:MAG TPA: DUF6159 family protein [Gaiellales bacterium]